MKNKPLWYIITFLFLFVPLLLCVVFLIKNDLRHAFLVDYISFNEYFSFTRILPNILFIIFFGIISTGLGFFTSSKLKIRLPLTFNFGIGLVLINFILIPLFFLGLFNPLILLALMAFIAIPASMGLVNQLKNKKKVNISLKSLYIWLVFMAIAVFYLINAILPINFHESFGDIANTYLNLIMSFASVGGIIYTPLLAGPISQFINFEIFSAALVSMTNPDVIKIFGLLLFFMEFLLILDFNSIIIKSKFFFLTACFLLLNIYFINPLFFSFAHPRTYILFLSSLSVFLIFIGKKKQAINYYFLAVLVSGILAITNYLGILLSLINLFFIFFDYRLTLNSWKKIILVILIAFLPFLIFSNWIWRYQGSPFPKSPIFNQIFNLKVNSDMSSDWVVERVALQSRLNGSFNLLIIAENFFKFLYDNFNLLTIFLLGGFFLLKKEFYFFWTYCLIYLFFLILIFPGSAVNNGLIRFQLITVPFFLCALNLSIDGFYIFFKKNIYFLSGKLSKFLYSLLPISGEIVLTFTLIIFLLRAFFVKVLIFLFQNPFMQIFFRLNTYQSWFFLLAILIIFLKIKSIFIQKIKKPFIVEISYNLFFFIIVFLAISQIHLVSASSFDKIHWFFLLLVFFLLDYWLYTININLKIHSKIFLKRRYFVYSKTIASFIVIFIIFKSFTGILKNYLELTDRKEVFSSQFSYLMKKNNFAHYLGVRETKINNFFNTNFGKNEKILYFFHAQGIYAKPFLVQANSIALTSIIYRSQDSQLIMKKLKSNGIKYLCVDNKWLIVGNDPASAMIADLNSVIFSPIFMSTYFVPVESGIKELYFFKINYNGSQTQKEIEKNFEEINKTGFFRFFYKSLFLNTDEILELKSNPNDIEKLKQEYKLIEKKIYPYEILFFETV